MAISKPENASQSTERDDEIERERDGRAGEFDNGYGYGFGHDGGRELRSEPEPEVGAESERGLEGDDAAPHQTTTGAVNRDLRAHDREGDESAREEGAFGSGAEEEPRAATLSTAEPAATMGHDAPDRDGSYRNGNYGDDEAGRGTFAQESASDQQSAIGRDDEELSQDSMSGDPVGTQAQDTPMQPASVPAAASATTPIGSSATSPQETSSAVTPTAQSPLSTDPGPVLAPEASLDFRERWHGIQAEFIDDPRRAVEDADRLVADVARAFTSSVEKRRQGLTSGWQSDEHGETEELRLTMRQYRALVDHILHD